MATRGQTISKAIELNSSPDVGGQLRERLATLPPPLAGEAEVVTRLREKLRDAIETLEGIACGNVPRNAQHVLKGIELLLRYTQPLPKQTVDVQGSVGIAVIDPYARAPEDEGDQPVLSPAAVAVLAAEVVVPKVQPKPPVVRRRAKEVES